MDSVSERKMLLMIFFKCSSFWAAQIKFSPSNSGTGWVKAAGQCLHLMQAKSTFEYLLKYKPETNALFISIVISIYYFISVLMYSDLPDSMILVY